MFAWRGFTIEQSKIQRVGPFGNEASSAAAAAQSRDSSSEEEEEDGELEISPEWKQRIVEAHNSLKQKQAQRAKDDKVEGSTESMELELKQGFETALLEFEEQKKRLQRA